ncbi:MULTISPECIES: hypothetical protein [Shewanella]|uniref:Secreted protein n=1 Tax=Shewanella oncorhynchi TaxID=2726434 RepID=A0ABX1KSS0_9GAMM|nr:MULTISPECIES: hypothetical protein [Shewanella]MBW3532996.1 hypothetical protein [Shewanella sp. NKUCC06_TVS]NLQ24601.1 hypothetical protein [Shewanella oncorhynchi]
MNSHLFLNSFRFLVFSLTLLPFSTIAWDGMVYGKVKAIHVTGHNNYDFRIELEDSPKLCGNEHQWAYVNQSDSNYQTYSSVLIAANLAGKNITIYTNQEKVSGNNYCHIGYVVLS